MISGWGVVLWGLLKRLTSRTSHPTHLGALWVKEPGVSGELPESLSSLIPLGSRVFWLWSLYGDSG